jgi:hypothetical protein
LLLSLFQRPRFYPTGPGAASAISSILALFGLCTAIGPQPGLAAAGTLPVATRAAKLSATAASAGASLAALPPSRNRTPLLDPNRTPYPSSSLHDFSNLLDAPAGKYGFLRVKGEHFVWANGERQRFWGINVANTSLQEPDADIDAIIAAAEKSLRAGA